MAEYVIRVGPSETVAVNLPPGSVITADLGGGCRPSAVPLPGDDAPVVAVLWGREFAGAWICRYYGGLSGIRNGRHKRDRAVWHKAATLIRDGGIARIPHERQEIHGRPVWAALTPTLDEGAEARRG